MEGREIDNEKTYFGGRLAAIHFPVAVSFVAQLQETVLGIMALAALGADEKRTHMSSFAVVVVRDSKSLSATASDQEQLRNGLSRLRHNANRLLAQYTIRGLSSQISGLRQAKAHPSLWS